jgi:hypothetical protein
MEQFQFILKQLIKYVPVLRNFASNFEKSISDIETKLCDLKLQKDEEDSLKMHKARFESNLNMMKNIIGESQRNPSSCPDNQAFFNQFKVIKDALHQCTNNPTIVKAYQQYKDRLIASANQMHAS